MTATVRALPERVRDEPGRSPAGATAAASGDPRFITGISQARRRYMPGPRTPARKGPPGPATGQAGCTARPTRSRREGGHVGAAARGRRNHPGQPLPGRQDAPWRAVPATTRRVPGRTAARWRAGQEPQRLSGMAAPVIVVVVAEGSYLRTVIEPAADSRAIRVLAGGTLLSTTWRGSCGCLPVWNRSSAGPGPFSARCGRCCPIGSALRQTDVGGPGRRRGLAVTAGSAGRASQAGAAVCCGRGARG